MLENIKLSQLIREAKRQVNAVCLLNVGKNVEEKVFVLVKLSGVNPLMLKVDYSCCAVCSEQAQVIQKHHQQHANNSSSLNPWLL